MIAIKCTGNKTMLLKDMEPFQGTLKQRTEKDIEELKESLEREGLLMPFAIWNHEDKSYLLDGHGRRKALLSMVDAYPEIVSFKFPIIPIEAETEDDARKALLQITSSYGRITSQGVKQFTVSIPNYVAPSIKKFVKPAQVKPIQTKAAPAKTIIKIRVDNDKIEQLKEVLDSFNWIEIL